MGASGSRSIKKLLKSSNESLARKIWHQIDTDKSGMLDQAECAEFVKQAYKSIGIRGS